MAKRTPAQPSTTPTSVNGRTSGHLSITAPVNKRTRVQKFRWTPAKRVACTLLGISTAGLICSLSHMTSSIQACTGGSYILAFCTAVIIDTGMIACEVAGLVSTCTHVQRCSRLYMMIACTLSVLLNILSVDTRTSAHLYMGQALNACIPVLMLTIMRTSVHLWTSEQ